MGSELTHAQRMQARNRNWMFADQVFDMYTRGESFRTISAATGIGLSTLHLMVKQICAEYVNTRYGDRNAVIGRELAILDTLTRKNLKAAQNGSKAAADIVLQASRDRRKLLGLDAATALELTVKTPTDHEIERLLAQLGDLEPQDVD
jgi:hypothetical protein